MNCGDYAINQLIDARTEVRRLEALIRAEKREKGPQWQNEQCKDWSAYARARDTLHDIQEHIQT